MFEQCKLSFSADALEPVIDALTIETHHGKHHAAYTKALNDFAEKAGLQDMPIEELLASLDKVADPALRTALRNNGGGYYNHNLYFETISPKGGGLPGGKLADAIIAAFGDFQTMRDQMSKLAMTQFGSGWSFLSTDKDGKLSVSNAPNQDNPISLGTGLTPIACIDVWEHAYYLKYKNLRAEYVEEIWKILDWEKIGEKYEKAIG
ncbi:MAG: superoxide dismutase [Lachnospiraceae bacterium]|nr:superoxide dismutase [Lachnospiraceae bacterium]